MRKSSYNSKAAAVQGAIAYDRIGPAPIGRNSMGWWHRVRYDRTAQRWVGLMMHAGTCGCWFQDLMKMYEVQSEPRRARCASDGRARRALAKCSGMNLPIFDFGILRCPARIRQHESEPILICVPSLHRRSTFTN